MASPIDAIAEALATHPGSTVRELQKLLAERQSCDLDRHSLNSFLYRERGRFLSDGDAPPRWYLRDAEPRAGVASRSMVPADRNARTRRLFAWQQEALDAWNAAGGRGIIEAVTGTGKTQLGIAAAAAELQRGGCVLVLVPSVDLMRQWQAELSEHLPAARIGCVGGGESADERRCNAVIAVVNSVRETPLVPVSNNGLLVADECHRYGSDCNSKALSDHFPRRLGLSATYARLDDGHVQYLDPYFGGVCYRMEYRRAIADDVVAHFAVALVGVRFSPEEKAAYDGASEGAGRLRSRLVSHHGITDEPFGQFMKEVGHYAEHWSGALSLTCRQYLVAFERRRRVLAECDAKRWILVQLERAIRKADRVITFTESIRGATNAVGVLELIGIPARALHSEMPMAERRAILGDFRSGSLRTIVAPRVLDEGIDVPAADLGVILAASKSKRQMIQRMGRVLRRKSDNRRARFVVAFVEGSSEDPRSGAHEDFLCELTNVAEDIRVVDSRSDPRELCRYLNALAPTTPVRPPRFVGEPPRAMSNAASVGQSGVTDSRVHGRWELSRFGAASPGGPVSSPAGVGSPQLASQLQNREASPRGADAPRPAERRHQDEWAVRCWYCHQKLVARHVAPDVWSFYDSGAATVPHYCPKTNIRLADISVSGLPGALWAEIMRRKAGGALLPVEPPPPRAPDDKAGWSTDSSQTDASCVDAPANPPLTRSVSATARTGRSGLAEGSLKSGPGGFAQPLPHVEWSRCSSCGTRVVGALDLCAKCLSEQ